MNNRIFLLVFSLILLLGTSNWVFSQKAPWLEVDQGLYLGEFTPLQKSPVGDYKIIILKINPACFTLKLLCASEMHHENLSIQQWGEKYKLIAAINASMFQQDYKTSTGYMKNYNYINNSSNNKKFLSIAAFNPIAESNPTFHMYDLDVDTLQNILNENKALKAE